MDAASPQIRDITAPSAGKQPVVILAGHTAAEPHFAGVAEALAERGVYAARMTEQDPGPVIFFPDAAAVVVCDCDRESPLCRYALRRAAAGGARTVLLMDGVLEWRNTFCNPRVEAGFLRPAPVDLVACAGDRDREILEALGNEAVVTGLPRLARASVATGCSEGQAVRGRPGGGDAPILIATAKTPAFSREERARLSAALARLRDALAARSLPALWRLTGDLHLDLGVPNDDGPLANSLDRCRAVLTTPSTLLVEAMLTGKPAALVHPHPAPLWPLAPLVWRDGHARDPKLEGFVSDAEQAATREVSLDELIDFAAGAREREPEAQAGCLRRMHAQGDAAAAVADAIVGLIGKSRRRPAPPPFPSFARLPDALPPPSRDRPRIALMVSCDFSPIGGVMSWALRLARHFAREPSFGFDVRVLAVLTQPTAARPGDAAFNLNPDGLTSICQTDPYDDRHVIVETVAAALERLQPDVVLPGFNDLCWMAAMQARRQPDGRPGARTIAVAHSDEPYYADLMTFYDRWETGAAVSARCMEWMRPILRNRPCATLPYAVPIASEPRPPSPADRPLQIAYIGRMVRVQKRVFDLLDLIDGLERRGVPFHFHLVGDGADLPELAARIGKRELVHGRVTIHGRRDVAWVERFLATIDVSVLVSDFEGTSITMLEAMGQGVVPAVTRIASGVGEWIDDGVNGVTVPIGATDELAARLAELAADRKKLARLGRAAWQRVKRDLSPDLIARGWADLFRQTLAVPFDLDPTDLGTRSMEAWRWTKHWVDDPDAANAWCRGALARAGYRRILDDAPAQTGDCDAVVARSCGRSPTPDEIAAWRAGGLGVAHAPLLMPDETAERVRRAAADAVAEGARRIAIYGVGRHSRKIPAFFSAGLPLVGFTDDRLPAHATLFGLPIVSFGEVAQRLRPDAILLSSDVYEPQMWKRCAPLRARGIRTIPIYGQYDETASARQRPLAAGAI